MKFGSIIISIIIGTATKQKGSFPSFTFHELVTCIFFQDDFFPPHFRNKKLSTSFIFILEFVTKTTGNTFV